METPLSPRKGARTSVELLRTAACRLAEVVEFPYTCAITSAQVIAEYKGASDSQIFPSGGRVPSAQYAEVVRMVQAEGAAKDECCDMTLTLVTSLSFKHGVKGENEELD